MGAESTATLRWRRSPRPEPSSLPVPGEGPAIRCPRLGGLPPPLPSPGTHRRLSRGVKWKASGSTRRRPLFTMVLGRGHRVSSGASATRVLAPLPMPAPSPVLGLAPPQPSQLPQLPGPLCLRTASAPRALPGPWNLGAHATLWPNRLCTEPCTTAPAPHRFLSSPRPLR